MAVSTRPNTCQMERRGPHRLPRQAGLGWLLLTVLLGISLLLPTMPAVHAGAVQETEPGIAMDVWPAFDGLFKYGEWLLLWADLAYDGSVGQAPEDQALEAEVRVRVSSGGLATVYATPVSLPPGARKRVPVYVLPNPYSHELEVELVAGSKVLATRTVALSSRPNNHYLVGAAAPSRGALAFVLGISLPGSERPTEMVDLSPADLPERAEGLASFDCIILNDVDTSLLSPAQMAALQAWVSDGGRLVLGGGAGAQRVLSGMPEPLLPVQPGGLVEVDELPGLAAFARAGAILVPGPFVVAVGEAVEGRVLASQAAPAGSTEATLPLLRERNWGAGTVDFVALDLTSAPFDAWSGSTAFWERLLSPGASYPDWLPRDVSQRQMRGGQMTYALSNLPSLDLPSVRGLALVLALYIVMVGPVNYVVLRRKKRLHWAWVTIPALTLIFSAGAIGIGYAMRGTDLLLNEVALVEPRPDGSAAVTSYLGLFSPAQRSYEIEVVGAGLLAPLSLTYDPWGGGPLPSGSTGDTTFVQGDPGRVRGLAVNQWSMQTFSTEAEWPDFGQIAGDLRLEDGKLVGVVHNRTAYPLADAVLLAGDEFLRLGDLAPGQEAPVSMSLGGSAGLPFSSEPLVYRIFQPQDVRNLSTEPGRVTELKRTVAQGLFEGGYGKYPMSVQPPVGGSALQAMILGWLDTAPPEVRIDGRQVTEQTMALVYASLPYHLPETGQIHLPPGLITGLLAGLPEQGGPCGPNGQSVYIGLGQASFEFRVPEELEDVRIDALELMLASDGGMQSAPETELYLWEAETWMALDEPILGTNVVEEAGDLVGPGGLVLVRLSNEAGGASGCYYVNLGLEGSR